MNKTTALDNGTVTISSTAEEIVPVAIRDVLIVTNTHQTDSLYIGASDVSTSNGTPVGAGGSVTLERFCGALYGIRGGSNDIDVRYLVTG